MKTLHGENTLVDDLLRTTDAQFERHRHSHRDPAPCVHASFASARYINIFWAHLAAAVGNDPNGLGMRATQSHRGRQRQLNLADVYQGITKGGPPPGEDREFNRVAAVLAPLIMTDAVLNSATQSFAESFETDSDETLSFEVEAEQFVSLRTLLPLRDDGGRVGANAPSLVMGGTSTAVKMCWNLLLRTPRALFELNDKEPSRAEVEKAWVDTRELIFRIGSGSLVAFVSFASACTDDPNAMLWPNMDDLSLILQDDQYLWNANAALVERFKNYLQQVHESQQGHYVGCAALYTKVEKLKLRDTNEAARTETTAFAEILRWISLVAENEYFPLFD
ncbi:MAG: hypothetical protein ACU84Q_07230 [Gammaproteobacteria bacterium]